VAQSSFSREWKCENCGETQSGPRARMPCPKCRGYVRQTGGPPVRSASVADGCMPRHLMPRACAGTVADDTITEGMYNDIDFGGSVDDLYYGD